MKTFIMFLFLSAFFFYIKNEGYKETSCSGTPILYSYYPLFTCVGTNLFSNPGYIYVWEHMLDPPRYEMITYADQTDCEAEDYPQFVTELGYSDSCRISTELYYNDVSYDVQRIDQVDVTSVPSLQPVDKGDISLFYFSTLGCDNTLPFAKELLKSHPGSSMYDLYWDICTGSDLSYGYQVGCTDFTDEDNKPHQLPARSVLFQCKMDDTKIDDDDFDIDESNDYVYAIVFPVCGVVVLGVGIAIGNMLWKGMLFPAQGVDPKECDVDIDEVMRRERRRKTVERKKRENNPKGGAFGLPGLPGLPSFSMGCCPPHGMTRAPSDDHIPTLPDDKEDGGTIDGGGIDPLKDEPSDDNICPIADRNTIDDGISKDRGEGEDGGTIDNRGIDPPKDDVTFDNNVCPAGDDGYYCPNNETVDGKKKMDVKKEVKKKKVDKKRKSKKKGQKKKKKKSKNVKKDKSKEVTDLNELGAELDANIDKLKKGSGNQYVDIDL